MTDDRLPFADLLAKAGVGDFLRSVERGTACGAANHKLTRIVAEPPFPAPDHACRARSLRLQRPWLLGDECGPGDSKCEAHAAGFSESILDDASIRTHHRYAFERSALCNVEALNAGGDFAG